MPREERNKMNYIIALVAEFATKYHINEKQAFNYLNRFKGLRHAFTYYDVLHTFDFGSAVDAMTQVCQHNGGEIR